MEERVTLAALIRALEDELGMTLKPADDAVLKVYFAGDFTVTARMSEDGQSISISTPVMAIHEGLPAIVLARVLSKGTVGGHLRQRENSDFMEIADHCRTDLGAASIVACMIAQKNAAIQLTSEIREAIGALL